MCLFWNCPLFRIARLYQPWALCQLVDDLVGCSVARSDDQVHDGARPHLRTIVPSSHAAQFSIRMQPAYSTFINPIGQAYSCFKADYPSHSRGASWCSKKCGRKKASHRPPDGVVCWLDWYMKNPRCNSAEACKLVSMKAAVYFSRSSKWKYCVWLIFWIVSLKMFFCQVQCNWCNFQLWRLI